MERYKCFLILLILHSGMNISVYAKIIPFPGRYNTIQDCIDAAFQGDTVLIAQGYYFENIHFRGKEITVASHFILDNDTSHILHTIIDGSRFTDSLSRSTVNMNTCMDTASVLKGLTITGGGGSLIGLKPNEHWGGGGILLHESSGKIENNIIRDNSMDYDNCVNTGGGILATAIDGHKIVIRGNLIQSNVIQTNEEADAGGLCAVAAKDGHILIENNRIMGNRAICLGNDIAHGGGVSLFGLYPEGASLIFRNNYVAYNRTSAIQATERIKAFGGGINVIYFDFPSDSRVLNPFLIISNNKIHDNYSSEWGGGISIHAGNKGINKYDPVCPQIFAVGNELRDNQADFGPGIHVLNTAIVLLDNILDDDLTGIDKSEIYNTNINYAFPNDGIINASGNHVKKGFRLEGRVYRDFPVIHSHAHRWKVKEISSEKIKMKFFPPPWAQWWAVSIYFLVLVLIFWLYRRYLFYRFNLKAALELEKKEKERIMHLDQVRSRFFANISHEFRTPLTLIDAPLQELLEDTSTKGKRRFNLELMQENVKRLLNLIRQLLELGRLEAGAFRLQVTEGDLNSFVSGLAASYESIAEHRQISYDFHPDLEHAEVFFDPDKIEKIVHNLLSNAFKYCNAGDRIDIYLRFHQDEERDFCRFELEVADTGPGLSEDQKEHLFDRFYRADSKYKSDREGSGIGLSLVKELVELYRGKIHVESKPGSGSRFVVSLPCGKSDFVIEEFLQEINEKPDKKAQEPFRDEKHPKVFISHQDGKFDLRDLPCVLIVEDNEQLRGYMISHMEDELCVLQAENGRKGMEMAISKQPDVIISDLMMPEMDGGEMVELLRNDERSCHIPIIMLTARGDMESRLDCFEKGSDAFMEKPFKMEELKARIHQMIRERKKLKEHYLRLFTTGNNALKKDFHADHFLSRFENYIRENLGDPELNIETISQDMGLSRIQFYRKVQHSTGMSPGDWVRNVRLARASQLFREGAETVTEVMLEVGFTNPSHFAASFRELHGCNPSTYRRDCLKS